MTNKKLKIIAISSLALFIIVTTISIILVVILIKNKQSPSWHKQYVELVDLNYEVNQPKIPSRFWEVNIVAKIKDYNLGYYNYGRLEAEFEFTQDNIIIRKIAPYMKFVFFDNNGFDLKNLLTQDDFPLDLPPYSNSAIENVVIHNVYFFVFAYN